MANSSKRINNYFLGITEEENREHNKLVGYVRKKRKMLIKREVVKILKG